MPDQIKVLVVEDEETWIDIYERTLTKVGYNFHIAPNFDVAAKLMDYHFFHVALLDIVLDARDQAQEQGLELLQRLQQTHEDTGFVLVTGYPSFERMDRAYAKLGVTRFLRKDTYRATELLDELAKASEAAKAYLEIRKREDLRPQHLLRRLGLRDLETQILGRQADRMLELLQALVRQHVPLLSCGAFEALEDKGGTHVFQTRYWSRLTGAEILVRIGRRKTILDEVNELKEAGREVFFETRQDISGLRYTVPSSSPSRFKDCPG